MPREPGRPGDRGGRRVYAQKKVVDKTRDVPEPENIPEPMAGFKETAQKAKRELDDVLDDIDKVLEENAEEFVKAYVQKGGE